jgi:hypothetical protein
MYLLISPSLLTAMFSRIMSQPFSWGQFSATEEAFRRIMTGLKVFTPFLDVAYAFGKRTDDEEHASQTVFSIVRERLRSIEFGTPFGMICLNRPPDRNADFSA